MTTKIHKDICSHDWWYLESIWEQGCAGAICIICKKIGCYCDAKRNGLTINEFMMKRVKNSKSIDSRYIKEN